MAFVYARCSCAHAMSSSYFLYGSKNAYAERYRRDLRESVIPFWLNHSLDREHGGYFTCLDRDGTVYDTKKYVWLQGRAVWMFSRLYNEIDASGPPSCFQLVILPVKMASNCGMLSCLIGLLSWT